MRRRGAMLLAAVLPLVLFVYPAAGQGWIEPLPGRTDPGVVKVRTSVNVRVTNRVALVEVEEWFRNTGGGLGEGDYIYPLPGEAVFSDFSLFQGDHELRGETMDADRARSIYESIVRRRKDPALIELVGHGMVRARVFPIAAGETRRIIMRYTQVLARAGDALQFRYAAGGRSGGIAPAGGEHAQGPQRVREAAPLSFTLTTADGTRFRDAFSPTHEVRTIREGRRLSVRPEGSLEGDFVLFLPLTERAVGLTLATHRPTRGEDGYFMLTLSPADAEGPRVAKDVTVVVDVSGSMSGEKIEQARTALRQLLGTLDRGDRFRLIRFSSGVSTYRDEWSNATAAELRGALEWVDALRANGGTNIAGALREAFRAETPAGRLPVVIFMTDGLPSVGETNPERIAQQAEREAGETRVFAFGVGYDVNTYLLDRLGVAGRGGAQYVRPGEDIEMALSTLALKIQHPMLTDLEIAGAPVRLEEVYPRRLPDLFAGEELVIFGRYRAAPGTRADARGQIEIRGRRGARSESYATHAAFPAHETANDFIPRLWASRKLGVLQQEFRLNGRNPELIDEIRATALRYGLLSELTSYLVQEPDLVAASPTALPVPGRAGADMSAAAQSGARAVERAEMSRQSREVRNMAQMMVAQKAAESQIRDEAEGDSEGRVVAGRIFRLVNGVWTDASHKPNLRVIRVERFGDNWFALLRALPELAPVFQQFERVIVAGRELAIEVTMERDRTLPPAEIERLVNGFRVK